MILLKKIIYVLLSKARILKYIILSDNKPSGSKPKLVCPVLFSGKGDIILGDHVQFGYPKSPLYFSNYSYIEARAENAIIKIGNHVVINNHCNMVSVNSIEIQDYCTIGVNFNVIDSDFHHLEPNKRNDINPPSKPVLIGKHVFIGNNVTILKGVTIGDNAVIGNGSMVTKSVAENTAVAGNPAQIIKTI